MPIGQDVKYYCYFETERWQYKLELLPPGLTVWESANVKEISKDCFNIVGDLNTKFQKEIPRGATIADSLPIRFSLLHVDADLMPYIRTPILSGQGEIYTDIGTHKHFDLSTIAILYRTDKANGREGCTKPIFIGCVKREPNSQLTINNDGMFKTLDFINVLQHSMQQLTSQIISEGIFGGQMNEYFQGGIKKFTNKYAVEFYLQSTQQIYIIQTSANAVEATWFDYDSLWKIIELGINIILSQLLRTGDINTVAILTVTDNPFIALTYYKIDPEDSGNRHLGTALSNRDLYFIGTIHKVGDSPTNYDLQEWGFLIENHNSNPSIFDFDSAWDFYVALTDAKYCQMILGYESKEDGIGAGCTLTFKKLFSDRSPEYPWVTLDKDLNNEVILEYGDAVITGSTGNIVGLTGSDFSENKYPVSQNLSDKDYTFKTVFHNMVTTPTKSADGKYPMMYNDGTIIYGQEFSTLKIYYKDSAIGAFGVGGYMMYKVHESIKIDNGYSTPVTYYGSNADIQSLVDNLMNYAEWSFKTKDVDGLISSLISILIIYQKECNEALAIATETYSTFSHIDQISYSPEYDMNTEIWGIESIGRFFAFIPSCFNFSFYLNDVNNCSDLNLNGYCSLMEVKENLEKETFSLKFLRPGI